MANRGICRDPNPHRQGGTIARYPRRHWRGPTRKPSSWIPSQSALGAGLSSIRSTECNQAQTLPRISRLCDVGSPDVDPGSATLSGPIRELYALDRSGTWDRCDASWAKIDGQQATRGRRKTRGELVARIYWTRSLARRRRRSQALETLGYWPLWLTHHWRIPNPSDLNQTCFDGRETGE